MRVCVLPARCAVFPRRYVLRLADSRHRNHEVVFQATQRARRAVALGCIERRERFRFLWLRTWDHPVSIRIEKNEDGTASLTLKVATGSGGYEPGKLDVARTKQLSKDEFEAINAKFTTSGFWAMATTEHSNGRDGARWVVEAANSGQYHLVDRWSPKEGALRDLALHLLRLSDYQFPMDKMY